MVSVVVNDVDPYEWKELKKGSGLYCNRFDKTKIIFLCPENTEPKTEEAKTENVDYSD